MPYPKTQAVREVRRKRAEEVQAESSFAKLSDAEKVAWCHADNKATGQKRHQKVIAKLEERLTSKNHVVVPAVPKTKEEKAAEKAEREALRAEAAAKHLSQGKQ